MNEPIPSASSPSRPWVRALGTVIALFAIGFVAWKAWARRDAFGALEHPARMALAILLGSVAYGAACLLLSAAWRGLLAWHGRRAVGFRTAHVPLARTAVAKYLPGNVLHLAGRHVLARGDGFSHVVLAGAALHEAASLVAVSGLVALSGLGLAGRGTQWLAPGLFLGVGLLAVVLPVVILRARRWRAREERLPSTPVAGVARLRTLVGVHLAHLAFFVAGGAILFGLLAATGQVPADAAGVGVVLVAHAASWAAGFVTPGAPAGLGVREALLITLLAGAVPEGEAVVVAVAFRLVTVLGDVVFFATSFVGVGVAADEGPTLRR